MAAKTSMSDPLQIAEIHVREHSWMGLTFCPGKKQPTAMTGPWDRDLATDLDAIEAWGADAVVTLMEQHELSLAQVAELGDAVEARGIEWYHLPIRDVDVPDEQFESRWIYAGLRLRRRLASKGRVLVHCRGGIGRTGTIAARLLVELGEEPALAIALVREARPGAIETRDQERHVLAAKPPGFNEAYVERLLGCLLGGAVGDAFGYAVEFKSLLQIRKQFGPGGLQQPVYQDGRLVVSDDTQMTLFGLEGMVRALRSGGSADHDKLIEEVRLAYLDWLDTQSGKSPKAKLHGSIAKSPALRVARAPGNTCLSALRKGGRGTLIESINDSKGCGAVMRVAPFAFLSEDHDAVFDIAARAGALTHGHVDGWSSGAVLAGILHQLRAGYSLYHASRRAVGDAAHMAHKYHVRGDIERYVRAYTLGREMRFAPDIAMGELGHGWTGEEALAIGLYAAISGRGLMDALRRAANHDGDSDSTASIAGQLFGAWKGVTAIPHRYVRRLDVLEPLLALVRQMTPYSLDDAPTSRSPHSLIEREAFEGARKVLEAVHSLHRRGFQHLRIQPQGGTTEEDWCVSIIAVPEAQAGPHGDTELLHRARDGDASFGWEAARGVSADDLATMMLERAHDLCRAGRGRDWAYAGWYTEMLGHLLDGALPSASGLAQSPHVEPPPGPKIQYGNLGESGLPAPPAPQPDVSAESAEAAGCEAASFPTPMDYAMSDEAQRVAALVALYHQFEELLPFIRHVWERLAEPRADRCTLMGQKVGVGGSGRIALRRVLQRYYDEVEAALQPMEAPELASYGNTPEGFAAWNAAYRELFARMDGEIDRIAQRYSAVLDGQA